MKKGKPGPWGSVPCQHCLQPAGWWPASAACAGPCSSAPPGSGGSSPVLGSRPSGSGRPRWPGPARRRRSGSPLPLYPSHSGPRLLSAHTSERTCQATGDCFSLYISSGYCSLAGTSCLTITIVAWASLRG